MTLQEILADLLHQSRDQPKGVHRKLRSGLHVQVQTRGERQRLMCWRTTNQEPGDTECATVARDAGFLVPRFQDWTLPDGTAAVVISDDAQRMTHCEHSWGMSMHGDGRLDYFYASTCTRCGAQQARVFARRGKRVEHHYNDVVVTEVAFQVLVKRGPPPPKPVESPLGQPVGEPAEQGRTA